GRETAPSGNHREVTRPGRPHSRSPPCHSHPRIQDPALLLPTTLRVPSPSFWQKILAPTLCRFNKSSRLDMAFHVALQWPPKMTSRMSVPVGEVAGVIAGKMVGGC